MFKRSHKVTVKIQTNQTPEKNAVIMLTLNKVVSRRVITVNFLNIRTPKKFIVIILKFELCGSTIEQLVQTMQTQWQTV